MQMSKNVNNDVSMNPPIDWKSVYRLPFICTKITKLITFQFKLLHRRLVTNDFLKKIGIKNNDRYTFCEVELENLRVNDSKYRESLDRFEKSKTLKLCLKNAFREFSSKMLFRFSKNLTSSRNSQKTKIRLFTSLNMQKISGKLTKFSVFALKQFTILEHRINLAQKFHLSSI